MLYKTALAKPSTNGACECFNETLKVSLRAMNGQNVDLNQKLNCFLLTYRNAIRSVSNQSRALMFLGRKLRTHLDDQTRYTSTC